MTTPILQILHSEVMIPPLYLLLVTSVTVTITNAVFNILVHRDGTAMETFRQWRRVLWMSRAAHIVEAPSAEQTHRITQTHHTAAVTAISREKISRVELHSSAAFFRGISAPTDQAIDPVGAPAPSATDVVLVSLAESEPSTPVAHAGVATPYNNNVELAAEEELARDGSPPSAVPAPVVVEALTNTMDAVRLQSQRIIFEFHPYYIILCAVKAFAMLIYIQYHFGKIEGGWHRFCICGAANIFSGLLTPVWEHAMMVLLPLDPERAAQTVVREEEEKADSVFIVELLLRIGSVELSALPIVLMQGTSFVVFSAVLLPLFVAFCLAGLIRHLWIYVPLWLIYFLGRHVYYKGAGTLPSLRARNAAAVVGMTNEMLKAFLMKALTVFVLMFTFQSTFLLGLAWAERATYNEGLKYMALSESHFQTSPFATPFHTLCLLSQFFF
ncbi:hypothetical protein JKF63_03224 [Porcisia hertigi]|uniref:Transmembrane protein n=1 Tax=Porcisia hertigi TaxID=2761500 RepID=A0A836L749_9TRYP|nr:hypothetical protein JKF63_03224 [Porcisia hertigi]